MFLEFVFVLFFLARDGRGEWNNLASTTSANFVWEVFCWSGMGLRLRGVNECGWRVQCGRMFCVCTLVPLSTLLCRRVYAVNGFRATAQMWNDNCPKDPCRLESIIPQLPKRSRLSFSSEEMEQLVACFHVFIVVVTTHFMRTYLCFKSLDVLSTFH